MQKSKLHYEKWSGWWPIDYGCLEIRQRRCWRIDYPPSWCLEQQVRFPLRRSKKNVVNDKC
jgi:hypothetical protein